MAKAKVDRIAKSEEVAGEGVVIEEKRIGSYFTSDKPLDFISSGCQLLDNVLGGGYPVGRVVNIVGDKSSGKTLLCIEACANFVKKHPDGKIYYFEAEAAFDKGYAEALGLPVKNVVFVKEEIFQDSNGKDVIPDNTVEGLFENLNSVITIQSKKKKDMQPVLYIVDSLDALSDRDELDKEIDKGSYGAKKPKVLSELFRRLIDPIQKSQILILVVSQIRDKIGVTFGEKHSRSGGKALDFYATQILWLADIGKEMKTIQGVERPIAVNVKAKCKKNKIGLAFRDCEFPILFGFGIDDLYAGLAWLDKVKALNKLSFSVDNVKKTVARIREEKNTEQIKEINALVKKEWNEIEVGFLPTYKKY